MAIVDNYIDIPGLVSGQDMSGKQFRAVQMDTDDFEVTGMTNANAEHPIGILQNDPTEGQAALVAFAGVCRAEVGSGGVTFGDTLGLTNAGKVITDAEVTDGSAVDLHHIGIALQDGADTQIILILLKPAQRIGKE